MNEKQRNQQQQQKINEDRVSISFSDSISFATALQPILLTVVSLIRLLARSIAGSSNTVISILICLHALVCAPATTAHQQLLQIKETTKYIHQK